MVQNTQVLLKSGGNDHPRRLTFTWWGCCGLYLWYKATELAHTSLFWSCVCFCLYGLFNSISFHKFSRQLSHSVLLVLFLPYWSFQLYISFIKVSLSSDITLCAWLGLKHQLTNYGCVSRKKKWNCKTFRRQVFFGCGRISYIQASFKTRCFLICCYCTMY